MSKANSHQPQITTCCTQQQGSALLICLVLAAALTTLAMAMLQGVVLELKMTKNMVHRQVIQQAAEYGLRYAEQALVELSPNDTMLSSNQCADGSTRCFESSCAGGYCFAGSYDGQQATCQLDNTTNPAWMDNTLAVWATPTKHHTAPLPASAINELGSVHYIIEFQCFIDTPRGIVADNAGAAYYRITALAIDTTARTQVMLQSTYSIDNNTEHGITAGRRSWNDISAK